MVSALGLSRESIVTDDTARGKALMTENLSGRHRNYASSHQPTKSLLRSITFNNRLKPCCFCIFEVSKVSSPQIRRKWEASVVFNFRPKGSVKDAVLTSDGGRDAFALEAAALTHP